ncbi:hypothetical protein D3C87_1744590 [compost metagenome]
MLHPVAKLRQHGFRHVQRVLRHEIDAHTLGADQPHHLFHSFDQHLRRVVEQEMRLVEEEHQPRLVRIAHFRQRLEQFRQQPKQEGAVEPRVHHQLVGRQHRDRAAPVIGGAHDVLDLKRRLAEEMFRTLLLQHQQPALQRADRGFRDQAVLAGQL